MSSPRAKLPEANPMKECMKNYRLMSNLERTAKKQEAEVAEKTAGKVEGEQEGGRGGAFHLSDVYVRAKRAHEREAGKRGGWSGHERSDLNQGVSLYGGSGLLSERSQRKEGASFCGGCGQRAKLPQRRHILLRRKQARLTKERPPSAEAGCLSERSQRKEGASFCGGCGQRAKLPQRRHSFCGGSRLV
jgi:hypothetical protein